MEKQGWRTTAIVALVVLGLLVSYNIYSVAVYYDELEKSNICYYNICEEHPEAWYSEDVCTCYDYDTLGNLVVDKTQLME